MKAKRAAGILLCSLAACTPEYEPSLHARVVCQEAAEGKLRAPRSAVHSTKTETVVQESAAGLFTIRAFVDAQNDAGVMIRRRYECQVRRMKGAKPEYTLEQFRWG